MAEAGKVEWFDPGKGYGFIKRADGGKDVFVHHSQIQTSDSNPRLKPGDAVEFNVDTDPRGRACARDVRVVDQGAAL